MRAGGRRARCGAPRPTRTCTPARLHGPLHGVPFTIKDSLDTAGVVTTAGHGRLGGPRARPRRDGRRPAEGGRRDPARQDEHAGVHLVERGRQPRLRPDVQPVRPGALARREQRGIGGHRRGRRVAVRHRERHGRQHPAAVAPVRRGRLKPTSGRVPRTGHAPSYRGILESLHPAGTDRPARRGPRAPPADHRRPRRRGPARAPGRRSATRRRSTIARLRVAWFADDGIETPDARDDGHGAGGGRDALRDAGATVEERMPPDQGRAAELWDRLDRRRRLRLAVAAHRGGRDRGASARTRARPPG